MTLRYLRPAFVAFSALAALLLAMLWVRSYWHFDELFNFTKARTTRLDSNCGQLQFATELQWPAGDGEWIEECGLSSGDALPNSIIPPIPNYSRLGFTLATTGCEAPGFAIGVPHWCPTLVFAALALLSSPTRLQCRFSLRTLLIATTIIALALGVAAWART